MKKIIFTEGLGNQMFQYSFYLSLKHNNIPTSINTLMDPRRGEELTMAFGINMGYRKWYDRLNLLFLRTLIHFLPNPLVFQEDETKYNEAVYNTRKPFLYGYWINPEYFKDFNSIIKEAFTFQRIDEKNLLYAKRMNSENSISLHIRRGDYLKVQHLMKVFGDEYYKNAIDYIKMHVDNPVFYVFSDDPIWSESFMKSFDVRYEVIKHNGRKDAYKDIFLMTQCKHNIIANSTFSWWGAWLNRHLEHIVICPQQWINGRDFKPYLPEWVRL